MTKAMPKILYCETESSAAKISHAAETPETVKPPSVSDITRLEHRLGNQLLHRGLREFYGLTMPFEDLSAAVSLTAEGKPYLPDYPDIHFSISHAGGIVCCVFHERPVGIDTELPGYFPEILISRMFTEEEKSLLQQEAKTDSLRQEWFYRLYTLKEAYVKMTGTGLDTDLQAFSFSFEPGPGTGLLLPFCSDPSVQCFQTMLPGGHLLSLCYRGTKSPVIIEAVTE